MKEDLHQQPSGSLSCHMPAILALVWNSETARQTHQKEIEVKLVSGNIDGE
jgi:hypothetical protein